MKGKTHPQKIPYKESGFLQIRYLKFLMMKVPSQTLVWGWMLLGPGTNELRSCDLWKFLGELDYEGQMTIVKLTAMKLETGHIYLYVSDMCSIGIFFRKKTFHTRIFLVHLEGPGGTEQII